MITLSSEPRSKFNTLLHLDTIKQQSKPKEAPKKPENASFFLQLTGQAVGDRASVAEGKTSEQTITHVEETNSKLRKLDTNGNHAFESEFTKLLREAGESGQFERFFDLLT